MKPKNWNMICNIIIVTLFIGYTITTIPELFVDECIGVEDCFDFDRRMARLNVWDVSWIVDDFRHFVHMSLLVLSLSVFGNPKVLVLFSSILLLVVSYLLAVNLTRRKEAGIITLAVIIQSFVFYNYDTSVTYPSFWALLFVTSMYLVTTKWYASPLPYIISIPAKAITVIFFPPFLAFVWLVDIKKSVKIKITVLYGIIITAFIVIGFNISFVTSARSGFNLIRIPDFDKTLEGFVSWVWKGFANDQITLVILIFSSFIILTKMIHKPNAKALLAVTWLLILTSPFLIGFTTYDVWPYRMLVHVVAIALMAGFLVTDLSWTRTFLGKATSSPAKEEEQ